MRPKNRIENVQRIEIHLTAPCPEIDLPAIDDKHDHDGNRIDSQVAFGLDFRVQFSVWET